MRIQKFQGNVKKEKNKKTFGYNKIHRKAFYILSTDTESYFRTKTEFNLKWFKKQQALCLRFGTNGTVVVLCYICDTLCDTNDTNIPSYLFDQSHIIHGKQYYIAHELRMMKWWNDENKNVWTEFHLNWRSKTQQSLGFTLKIHKY